MNAFHRNKHAGPTCRSKRAAARGVTLVELMVVVGILLMLAAFAIPAMRPLTEGRRIREATRAIDVFITQAKIRSVEIQRPVGIEFQRMVEIDFGADPTDPSDDTILFDQPDACTVLRVVEVPSPYAGNFTNSRVLVQDWTRKPDGTYYLTETGTGRPLVVLKLMIQANDFSDHLIRYGDRIQLNYQGPVYTIFNDTTDDNAANPLDTGADFPFDPLDGYTVFARDRSGTAVGADTNGDGWIDNRLISVWAYADEVSPEVPWKTRPGPPNDYVMTAPRTHWTLVPGQLIPLVPFQITRQPEPSPIPPLRLPRNTVIDLNDSGYLQPGDVGAFSGGGLYSDAFGFYGPASNQRRGPMVMFTPNGSISEIYHWNPVLGNYTSTRAVRTIFLMVGKWERTGNESVVATQPIRSLAEDGLHNWQDATNLWIAIGPQNGMVTTAEVNAQDVIQASGLAVPGDPMGVAYPDPTDPTSAIDSDQLARQMYSSRAYARQSQISKGALSE